ncbi:hypothetical protein [Fervidicoccus fontis]|uniref:hypothetical protein n=1 Tax=Fervidicoccus fontis TaxID=683846 RepID=UPI0023544ED0|nr:hypothetical protein [Fervidicoccus fontis]
MILTFFHSFVLNSISATLSCPLKLGILPLTSFGNTRFVYSQGGTKFSSLSLLFPH